MTVFCGAVFVIEEKIITGIAGKVLGMGSPGMIISAGVFVIAGWLDGMLGHPVILSAPAPLRIAAGALSIIGGDSSSGVY